MRQRRKITALAVALVAAASLTACDHTDPNEQRFKDCIAKGGSFYANDSNPSWSCTLPGTK